MFGIDPVYVMVFLMIGLIGVIGAMCYFMHVMIQLLKGIKNATSDTTGHLRSLHARSVSSTVGRSVGGIVVDQRYDPDATVQVVRVSPGAQYYTGRR